MLDHPGAFWGPTGGPKGPVLALGAPLGGPIRPRRAPGDQTMALHDPKWSKWPTNSFQGHNT